MTFAPPGERRRGEGKGRTLFAPEGVRHVAGRGEKKGGIASSLLFLDLLEGGKRERGGSREESGIGRASNVFRTRSLVLCACLGKGERKKEKKRCTFFWKIFRSTSFRILVFLTVERERGEKEACLGFSFLQIISVLPHSWGERGGG